jgi:hypothetical protein
MKNNVCATRESQPSEAFNNFEMLRLHAIRKDGGSMLRTIITKTNSSVRTLCTWGVFLLTAIVTVALAAPMGGAMAGNDGPIRSLDVYYLSSRVLTRTRMSPDRLKRDTFKLQSNDLPAPGISNLFTKVSTTEHHNTGRNTSAYDFRLYISSEGKSVWFSSNGRVGYVQGEPFFLSSDERDQVLSLFGELDQKIDQAAKQKQ